MSRFFEAADYEMLSNTFIIFEASPGSARAGFTWDLVPRTDALDFLLVILRRSHILDADQFPTGTVPVRVREFIGVAFIDKGNFTRTLFHELGRRRAHSVPVH